MTSDEFRTIRTKHIGSQARCAELFCISIRAISRYETGENPIPPPLSIIMDVISVDSTIIETITELSRLD
jgi:transcriptional regulator with XRE-family HTH domain